MKEEEEVTSTERRELKSNGGVIMMSSSPTSHQKKGPLNGGGGRTAPRMMLTQQLMMSTSKRRSMSFRALLVISVYLYSVLFTRSSRLTITSRSAGIAHDKVLLSALTVKRRRQGRQRRQVVSMLEDDDSINAALDGSMNVSDAFDLSIVASGVRSLSETLQNSSTGGDASVLVEALWEFLMDSVFGAASNETSDAAISDDERKTGDDEFLNDDYTRTDGNDVHQDAEESSAASYLDPIMETAYRAFDSLSSSSSSTQQSPQSAAERLAAARARLDARYKELRNKGAGGSSRRRSERGHVAPRRRSEFARSWAARRGGDGRGGGPPPLPGVGRLDTQEFRPIPAQDRELLEALVKAVLEQIALNETSCPAGKHSFLKAMLIGSARKGYHRRKTDLQSPKRREDWKQLLVTEGSSVCPKLPLLSQVEERYGTKPLILGMDTCARYRELLLPEKNNGTAIQAQPRVAGLYHTGTNALAKAMEVNIQKLAQKRGSENPYDVPWGKHMPPAVFRLNNSNTKTNSRGDKFRVLPVVIVRDPFHWMKGMCKEWYDAKWEKPKDRRCPAIIKMAHNNTPYPVFTKLFQANNAMVSYTSLIDMWAQWNLQYLNADYPRLMIRFEDILYRFDAVFNAILNCTGLQPAAGYVDQPTGKAKGHGRPEAVSTSLAKYVQPHEQTGRYHGLNREDRQYANAVLNKSTLLNLFGYDEASLEVQASEMAPPFAGRNQPSRREKQWWLPGYKPPPPSEDRKLPRGGVKGGGGAERLSADFSERLRQTQERRQEAFELRLDRTGVTDERREQLRQEFRARQDQFVAQLQRAQERRRQKEQQRPVR